MDRISTGTKAVDLFGAGKHGWKNANLALGTTPTDFNAEWCNAQQEEKMSVIEGAGVVPAAGVFTQLRQALKRMFGGNVTTVNFAASPFQLTADHAGLVLVDAAAGDVMINLPAANVLAGLRYEFRRVDTADARTVTVNRTGADAIDAGDITFTLLRQTVQKIAADGVSKWLTATPVAATQAETTAGTNAIKFVAPLTLLFGFAASFVNSGGYIKLPAWLGGFMIQWGQDLTVRASGADVTLTYPLAFPTAVFITMVTMRGAGTATLSTEVETTTTFRYTVRNSSIAGANYFAVGK